MARQSKKESVILWQLELNSAETITVSDIHRKMLDVVTEKINDYSLTYDEYVTDVMELVSAFEDTNDLDERKKQVDNMCETLIKKYTDGSKEIR